MWFWQRNRHIDQWNIIENPQVEPQKYAQLVFDKDGKYYLLFIFVDLVFQEDFNFIEGTDCTFIFPMPGIDLNM